MSNFILLSAEKQIVLCKGPAKRFHLNGHTTGSHPQSQKLEPLVHFTTYASKRLSEI